MSAQRRLATLGCDPGPADGALGAHTAAALFRFQTAAGLRVTSRLDDATQAALDAATAPRCDVRPVPAGSGEGRRMVLSQRQNWIWLVNADGSVVAQGGMIDNPAVVKAGRYTIGAKCGRPSHVARNQDDSLTLWLYNFVRFAGCGAGFHQIPVSKATGAQIHADYLLGTNYKQSHGCVRVSAALSKSIWDFGTDGTPVVVVAG